MIVPELVGAPAAVQGSDISGTIAKVGPGVTRVFPLLVAKSNGSSNLETVSLLSTVRVHSQNMQFTRLSQLYTSPTR
jgi:hypothetical protein